MKFTNAIAALITSFAIITTALADTNLSSSTAASGSKITMAANKLKTIKHKVHTDNCQQKRKEIDNRCRYHHKMDKAFCDKQDEKNAAVCEDLKRKSDEHNAKQQQNKTHSQSADERFNACIRMSGCDNKTDDAATKWCYDHCHKRAGYGN